MTVLGASSTVAPEGDSNACLHATNGHRSILIDAGGNIPRLMDSVNLDYREITDVVITHSHPDHSYGFPFLSHAFYHGHRSVDCWSTAEAIPRLRQALEAFDLREPDRYLDVDFREIPVDADGTIPIDDDQSDDITTFPTRHSRPGFGLRFQSNAQHFVYSGDTAPLDPVGTYGESIDYLLHDCQATDAYGRYFREGHSTAAEVGRIGDQLDVNVLVPFHHNLIEFPPSRREILGEIREHYDGSLLFPGQGMTFQV